MEEIQTTAFSNQVELKHQTFLNHLAKIEDQARTLKQILHLAESIDADGIVMSCKNHVTTNLSEIPEE